MKIDIISNYLYMGGRLIIASIFIISQFSVAQNLIKNPSFEEFDHCPTEFGMLDNSLNNWNTPTIGSTDFFHTCSTKMPAGRNFIGYQKPYDGEAYVGIYTFGQRDYREYITAELKENLIEYQKYTLSFWVSLAEKSAYATNRFGMLFTRNPLKLKTKRNIPINLMYNKGYENYLEVVNIDFYTNKQDWVKITVDYIADGTEKYLTIGNFNGNNSTRTKNNNDNLKKAAYYYVDMISLVTKEPKYDLDEIYVIENLNFDLDDHKIREHSLGQLDSLVAYLKSNKKLNVIIYGHTDNQGSKSRNEELSKMRAKSVAKFLVANGLGPNRVTYKGFGHFKPVADNKTKKGRLKNRRVEFKISDHDLESQGSLSETLFEDDN